MTDELIIEEISLSDDELVEKDDGTFEIDADILRAVIQKVNEYNNRTLH